MLIANVLVLAADAGRGGQDPGLGLSLGLIAAVVVAVVLLAAAGFWLLHRLTRNGKGVQPRPEELRRGKPPFESIGRRRG
jgi:multisubunit Na+/H+ antiporter MnhB subunit